MFEIRKACGADDLEVVHCLRYMMYVERLKWIDAATCPNGLERDEYDDASVSFLAFVHGVPIGTVRLIMHSPKEFPIFREFGMPNEYFKHPSTEIKMGEVSRFICMPYDGGPRHAVSLALLQVLVRYSVHAGLTHWLQAMDATAYRLVRFFGFPLERFAPSKKFMGSMTHPTICGVQKSFQVFEKRFPDTFTLMSKDWAATEVVAVAGRALQARVAYS